MHPLNEHACGLEHDKHTKTYKHHIFTSPAGVHGTISPKLFMVIEDVENIIKVLIQDTDSFSYRVHRKFGAEWFTSKWVVSQQ